MDGCKILGFSAPLYFANADYFLQRVRSITKLNHTHASPNHSKAHPHHDAPLVSSLPHRSLDFPLKHLHMHLPASSIPTEILNDPPASNGCPRVDAATWTADFFEQPIKHVILDCSSICFVDINGVQAIKDLAVQCCAAGMTLFLTSCKADFKEMLALCGYSKHLDSSHIFMHVHDAVMQAVCEHEEVS